MNRNTYILFFEALEDRFCLPSLGGAGSSAQSNTLRSVRVAEAGRSLRLTLLNKKS